MAYRITGTTDEDTELLNLIRNLAWQKRLSVSQVIRDAFTQHLRTHKKKDH